MATINAAAAMHVVMRGTIAALISIFAVALAGCTNGGTGDLLSADNTLGTATGSTGAQPRARVAIAPIIGAPSSTAQQIVSALTAEISRQNIEVVRDAAATVDYTIRGYIVAARESSGTKVSYIWDVTNPTGARVHRITGEEVIKGAGAGDPWASVSPQVIQVIAAKTGQQLNSWMPQKSHSAPSPAVAEAATGGAVASAATSGSHTSTGSVAPAGGVTVVVPSVVGAPGDGSQSLATAMRNELMRNGIKPSAPGTTAYRVEGRVQMGSANAGKQPIKIDWIVRDPQGANLGTVSQENEIPAGSLNGPWGPTASAAATAATQGVLKLLPQRTASR